MFAQTVIRSRVLEATAGRTRRSGAGKAVAERATRLARRAARPLEQRDTSRFPRAYDVMVTSSRPLASLLWPSQGLRATRLPYRLTFQGELLLRLPGSQDASWL